MQAVNLSASSYFVPSKDSMKYINYGGAVSEVSLFLMHNISNVTCVIFSCEPYYYYRCK
jgi:hypothetical protein